MMLLLTIKATNYCLLGDNFITVLLAPVEMTGSDPFPYF